MAVGEHIERLYRTLYEVTETPRTAFGDSGRLLRAWRWRRSCGRSCSGRCASGPGGRGRCGGGRRWCWSWRGSSGSGRTGQRGRDLHGAWGAHRIRVLWPPMLPQDDVVEVQNQVRLVAAGLRSHRSAMDALGTESPEEELARVQADRAALGEGAVSASPLRGMEQSGPGRGGGADDDASEFGRGMS